LTKQSIIEKLSGHSNQICQSKTELGVLILFIFHDCHMTRQLREIRV